MRIEYMAGSRFAKVVILSSIAERKKLKQLIDKVLLFTPVQESSRGFFFRVTTIYGAPEHVSQACKIIHLGAEND
ncbi:TPA: hypothetical protein ACS8CD_001796 [Providencia alcalifaciens]